MFILKIATACLTLDSLVDRHGVIGENETSTRRYDQHVGNGFITEAADASVEILGDNSAVIAEASTDTSAKISGNNMEQLQQKSVLVLLLNKFPLKELRRYNRSYYSSFC